MWTLLSRSQTRPTVCFDFRHFVKLVGELEIRPACSPSTPPHARRIFSRQALEKTAALSPDLNAFLSRLLLSLTCAD